jgi:hypothetical protein
MRAAVIVVMPMPSPRKKMTFFAACGNGGRVLLQPPIKTPIAAPIAATEKNRCLILAIRNC